MGILTRKCLVVPRARSFQSYVKLYSKVTFSCYRMTMPSNQSLQPLSSFAAQRRAPNDAERYILALWLMLIFVVSLFGDSVILAASIKYNAFKLHKVLVTFIQHIAVCDLLLSFVSILTQSVSLMANGWVFGSFVCYVKVYFHFGVSSASRLLVCGMAVSKLLMSRYPDRTRSWSNRHAHITCAGLWALSCCVPAVFLIVDKDDIRICEIQLTCNYNVSSAVWIVSRPIITGVFVAIPTIIVVITSIFLVKHLLYARKVANRTRGRVRWQGIATVLLTAAVYCVSFIPKAIHMSIRMYVKNEWYHVIVPRVTETLTYFNVFSNFFVYSLTVPSFRLFLKTRMEQATSTINPSVDPGNYQRVTFKNVNFAMFKVLMRNLQTSPLSQYYSVYLVLPALSANQLISQKGLEDEEYLEITRGPTVR